MRRLISVNRSTLKGLQKQAGSCGPKRRPAMKQSTKNPSGLTIGLDVGDRRSVAIVLDAQGEVIEELKIASTKAGATSPHAA